MKKISSLAFFLVLFFSISFAQNEIESIIYLKNGYSIKGVIVEQTDKILKIRSKDQQVFQYSMDEVERISTETKISKTSESKIKSNTVFQKGDQILNFGLGIGNSLYSEGFYQSKIPPISAFYEFCVQDQLFDEKSSLGVGGYLGVTGAKDYGLSYTSIIIGPRAAVHYQLLEKFDTYGGLMLGYNIVSVKWTGDEEWGSSTASASDFTSSIFLGGRYYFNEKVAGLIELGYGISYITLGIAIKL